MLTNYLWFPRDQETRFELAPSLPAAATNSKFISAPSVFCSPEDEIYANHSEVTARRNVRSCAQQLHRPFIVSKYKTSHMIVIISDNGAVYSFLRFHITVTMAAKQHSIVTALQTFIKPVMLRASKPYLSSSYYRRWFKGMSNNNERNSLCEN